MVEKNIVTNLERYKRTNGNNKLGDRYNKPAYLKSGGELDPRRLSLKILQDADKGKDLELFTEFKRLSSSGKVEVAEKPRRQFTPDEMRELTSKNIPKVGIIYEMNTPERNLFEAQQEITRGNILDSCY